MNKFIKFALIPAAFATSMALTGCLDEVEPTNGLTQEQLNQNEDAGRALLYAIPGFMNNFGTYSDDEHIDFGYASMMRIRDLMTADMVVWEDAGGYDHYSNYEQARVGAPYVSAAIIWLYYTKQVLACNNALRTFPADSESESAQGNRAIALAYRAMIWLDMARWYECLPTDVDDIYVTPNSVKDASGQVVYSPGYTMVNEDGNNVQGLTIPIVTENTTEAESYDNPRLTHDEMLAKILEDLKYAEENIEKSPYYGEDKLLPNLACVYGLYARAYQWDENYPKASEYAQKAIQEAQALGCSVLSVDELTSVKNGFNTLNASSWMWGFQPESENRTVTTGICNWISMTSFEADYGYAAVGAGPCVTAAFYERINNSDPRKLWWIPSSDILLKRMHFCAGDQYANAYKQTYPYFSVKFRPYEGETSDYNIASCAAVPLMRLEEMYFIKFESDAHTSAAQGFEDMSAWMRTYRYDSYKPKASTVATDEQKIDEIVFQKRVEQWGEGLTLFDIKRLNMSVNRTGEDAKVQNIRKEYRLASQGRPGWMNMVFVRNEGMSNTAVLKYNNPDFYGKYKGTDQTPSTDDNK
ncbi:MAG: RagB/SusD family nutrient uptake outer membrane protein [Duncaniella sp.]|nr:RagB/SusD family nutrient uptake outer membrane protein [Duncaniella sp.]